VALDGVFDNVRLDVGSMPPAGAAPGGVVLARAPHAPRVLGDAPVIAARVLLFTPPSGQTWRSYYYAGSQRIAVRVEGDPTPANNGLFYLLSDHLGSTSVTTDASANKVAELRYYPYGQTRSRLYQRPEIHRLSTDTRSWPIIQSSTLIHPGTVGDLPAAFAILGSMVQHAITSTWL
jgi:hypothetical protein